MIGRITAIRIDTGSGLAEIDLETDTGKEGIFISSGFGLRQLFEAFEDDPFGKLIEPNCSAWGVMESFTIPEEDDS